MKANLQAARNWGDALFAAAKEAGVVGDVLEQAGVLIAATQAVPRFVAFIEAPHVPTEEKAALMEKVLGGRFHRLLRNFVLLMLKRNRIELLGGAVDEFRLQAERDQGLWRGSVRTAKPLGEAEREALRAGLEKYTKHQLIIDWKVDPAVLGGVVFKSGDLLVDNSLKTRLDAIGERLLAARVH